MIIYVLKLENNKYYVGKSKNEYLLTKRIQYHKSGFGSAYIKLYKPVKNCLIKHYEIDESYNLSEFSEDNEVKLCMKEFGIDNVRGVVILQLICLKKQLNVLIESYMELLIAVLIAETVALGTRIVQR